MRNCNKIDATEPTHNLAERMGEMLDRALRYLAYVIIPAGAACIAANWWYYQ